MVYLYIDEMVPCLKVQGTGEIVETVVFKVETKNFLSGFNKTNGWYVNWSELFKKSEIYVLATKKDMEIQGLISIENDKNSKAVFMNWACASPHNNKFELDKQGKTPKYIGVGGHLFAVAVNKSVEYGYNGVVHGYAANNKLLQYYLKEFEGEYLGAMHKYHFMINELSAKKNILEVYDYEWYDKK